MDSLEDEPYMMTLYIVRLFAFNLFSFMNALQFVQPLFFELGPSVLLQRQSCKQPIFLRLLSPLSTV